MSSSDLHQVVFKWPHTEPTMVIVTGTFDEWSSSIRLVKVPTGFEGVTQIPWEQKIKYKFIVDGIWLVHEDQPTEVDYGGFVNNTYTAPAKPVILPSLETTSLPLETEKPIAAEANNHTTNGDSVAAEVIDKPEYTSQPLPKHAQSLTDTDGKNVGALNTLAPSGFPHLLSDLASTIAARDGTSSALAYVASGLGAAMHSAVGIDPINIPKIAIPTPDSNNGDFSLPPDMGTTSPTTVEKSAPKEPSSPIAPLVPIMIVPVNAAENNTVVSSSPPESMHVLPRIAPSSKPPVVNTPHIPESVVKESTERTTESTPTPVFNALLTSETVIHESASAEAEVIHVESKTPAENGFPVLSETATTPANVEAEPVSTSSVTPTVAEVSTSNILVEQSTADPEPVIAIVIPSTDPNLVTEDKVQTSSSVPEVRDVQKTSDPPAIAPESHAGDAAVVIKRKVAEPTATPTIPTTFRKKAQTTSSVKDTQDFPSNSPTTDNSASSSRFNSVRKKRTSIFGKIKSIFHDKEKEKK